jgi:RNA polymerase sigma factor (sigma-70 family)
MPAVVPFPVLWANHRADIVYMVRAAVKGRGLRGLSDDRFQSLVAAGQVALWEASTRYDAEKSHRGGSLWSFAQCRIRGAIIDEMREWDHLPKSAREHEQNDELKETPWALLYPRELTEAVEVTTDDDPEEHAIALEKAKHVAKMISSLAPQEKTVAEKFIVERKTVTEVSRELKLSLERICQIRKSIMRKLLD